jgi:uncharacterized protein YjbJ (UPF0337 family)
MPDSNVIDGKLKQAEGLAQDGLSDVTGSEKGHAEGKLKQAEGKIQEAVGHAIDAVKDVVHNLDEKIHDHSKK